MTGLTGDAVRVQEFSSATLSTIGVGTFGNNAYLIRCRSTGSQLLIDAAADPDRLLGVIADGAAAAAGSAAGDPRSPLQVLTTHQHHDHWQALGVVVQKTGAVTLAGRDDAAGIPVATTRLLGHGDVLRVGALEFTVIGLRGHTPGSIALAFTDSDARCYLFTGDSLFPGGVGKTDSPEAFASLLNDVTARIFDQYADDTVFYPGHGDDSTVGAERPLLGEWRSRGW